MSDFDKIVSFGAKSENASAISDLLQYIDDLVYSITERGQQMSADELYDTKIYLQSRFGLSEHESQMACNIITQSTHKCTPALTTSAVAKPQHFSAEALKYLNMICADDAVVDKVLKGTWEHQEQFLSSIEGIDLTAIGEFQAIANNPKYRDADGKLHMHIFLYEILHLAGMQSSYLNRIVQRTFGNLHIQLPK